MNYLSQPIAGLLLLTSQLFSGRVTAIYHHLLGLDVINLAAVLIFIFCNFIQHWLSAEVFQIPPTSPMPGR